MADLLRETELTRTRFTSILKAELLIFPMMLIASFVFWSYITNLGPIPSDAYPYTQKFWPMHAQMKAVWASSLQEGQNLLLTALKPTVIIGALVGVLGLFGGFSAAGISQQYIYGGIGAINGYPHTAVLIFAGACLGRFILAKKFGKERWQNFAPILAVGFSAGLGLIGMLSIAINFLWTSIGTRY
jgi:predicted anti-sigma-YlaC factor YlaD